MTAAEQRLADVGTRLKDIGVRAIHLCWAEGAKERHSRDELCNAVAAGFERLLDGDYEEVALIDDDGAPL